MPATPVWKTRPCPECGAEPGTSCKTRTGGRAGLPHAIRYPSDEPRRPLADSRRRAVARAEDRPDVRRLPLDDALRELERARMNAFRLQRR